jgi:hypothetical protein
MVHTEKVHVMFGILEAIGGAGALWATARPRSLARLIWPAVTLIVGVFLFIPVEGHTLTYTNTGWWATIASAIPPDRTHWVSNWLRTLSVTHVLQHKIGAACIIGIAMVEFQRGRGRLLGPWWQQLMPALLILTGLVFGIHGGTSTHLPSRAEQLHHWILGTAFVIGGATLGLARHGTLRHRYWLSLWAVLTLLSGLDIALFYRLHAPYPTPSEAHSHESTGPGMR